MAATIAWVAASLAASRRHGGSRGVTRLLRSCHEALQSLQLQELYSAYTSHVHRTAIVIHSPDPGTRWLGPGLGLGLGLVSIPNPSNSTPLPGQED